jgi:hypothetical protein
MTEIPSKSKKKKRAPFGTRQLSRGVVSTHLWLPDQQLFDEMRKKRRLTPAELARDIIHKWAVTTRLAPDTEEGAQEIALLDLQKETKTLIEEAAKELSAMLKQVLETVSTHSDLLSLNETQLNHVATVADAHYNVSAQSFAAIWSVVEMFQRFYVEGALPETSDPHIAAIAIRDDIRGEGLRMIETFGKLCESTTPIKMILIYPSAAEPTR